MKTSEAITRHGRRVNKGTLDPDRELRSVLQDWVMELPLREQGTLLTVVRGCDLTPKYPLDSPERELVGWLRWCFLNPADEREVDIPGAFFQSTPPDVHMSGLGHYPLHWVMHVMHATEVIAYRHPDLQVAGEAARIYLSICRSLHVIPESEPMMTTRLSEDRIAQGTVIQ